MKQEVRIEDIPAAELIKSAMEARKKSYAPYSGYQVGAALLTNELRIYTGCNIENSAFTPTCCAERTAFLRRSARENGSLKRLPLWAISMRAGWKKK